MNDMLEAIYLRGKQERGEELTEEEQAVIQRANKRKIELELEKRAKEKQHDILQQNMHDNAIERASGKYCPLLRSACYGEDCAWFKVLKADKPDIDGYYHYDAMCAVTFPERMMHIDRR